MPLATKNGSLIVKSGSIAEDCNCCKSELRPRCCTSSQQFQSLKNVVIDLSFSGFFATNRTGIGVQGSSCNCDSQYGFPGDAIMQQAGFLGDWASHFNSITARLYYHSSTSQASFWRGQSGALSKPGGGTATYFFFAELMCTPELNIYRDEQNGCQQNGTLSRSGAFATSGPMASAPTFIGLDVVDSNIVAQCGQLSLAAQYRSPFAASAVYCAIVQQAGCFGAGDCSGYYAALFRGIGSAFISSNPLP